MHTLEKLSISVLMMGLNVGCMNAASGSSPEGSGSAAPLFLTLADISAPAQMPPDTAAVVSNAVSTSTNFYANQPTSQAPLNCLSTILFNIVVTTSDTQLNSSVTADVATCLSKLSTTAQMQIIYDTATLQASAEVICPTGGYSKFNGVKNGDLPNNYPCASEQTRIFQFKIAGSGSYSGTNGAGQPISGTLTYNQVVYNGDADLQPCRSKGGVATLTDQSGCETVNNKTSLLYSSSGVEAQPQIAFFVMKTAGVTISTDPSVVWPSSGQAQITFNNWNGTMTYSGPSTAPVYSLSAAGNPTVQGRMPAPQ